MEDRHNIYFKKCHSTPRGLFVCLFVPSYFSVLLPQQFYIWCFAYYRDAVVAVDRTISKENDDFQPHKRSRLYGITTAFAQCPQGDSDSHVPDC